ncbi:coiled-coil domain-containing protein 120 [Esox lucius]|uniref:Cytohesin Ubiquitin Protein Inducing domain-containing protein n=1 Tax=Esox lucius TaxID=8010 RepID=A0A3P8ZGW7_ESOLU|nr:coiled-coil domain-containing protein 120 [Esox lucius]XP_010880239.1 coiled-coil domain-containing protein 120 [Esox lucius]XP_019911509.1 coiled-coil domain-containing protein 120 [Esox lucius]XP_019911510.1 coiled-coil domain-containing protein 120 [Esox lucius]XP_019911511.1 coiled-coil domain-containing protein 120 [Esox lucius]XP_019911512.1 coiled-coil domain-containing protein 120 [Esox lucius]XP_019911513.1 coiled-coil domain-containing protein 120 [Esox lucius]XP_034143386.1 coi
MEVKGRLITSMGVGAPDQDSKMRAERISALQERKQLLEDLLSSRVGELRRVCLQEAELTGKVPRAFPLETGERVPVVQRRACMPFNNTMEEDEASQRRQMKTLFSGALYRHSESERNVPSSRRTVHRGCHTEDTVMSESTSSMSDSTSHDNEESSPSVAADHRSMSQPRLTLGSPDHRVCRKPSPVEIYYEMRMRRNSVTSSISPTHSLPRSASNVEGRSVPATPLLARTAPISVHVRLDGSGGIALKQWSGSLDVPHMVPLAQEGSSSDRRSCPYNSRARRSNSSEALLDRSSLPDDPAPRNGMPPRGGPYKSSEALTDGKLRHIHLGSPERHLDGSTEQGNMRLSMGGRGDTGGGGHNELLMDYIWGKQRIQVQHQLYQSTGRIWQDISSPRSSTAAAPPHVNGFSHSQVHLPSAAPPYSPMAVRGSQVEPRRVKVTRTKSCGPFIPLQQDAILLSAYESPHPGPGPTTSSIPNLHPYQTEVCGASFSRRPPQFSLPSAEDSARSLHKALALEGLRDWYLRNSLGYPTTTPKGHDAGVSRLSHPHPAAHQAQSVPGEPLHRSHMSQSASFHGHPLHGRSMEFSLYQEPLHPQMQDMTPKEPSADPGTLV